MNSEFMRCPGKMQRVLLPAILSTLFLLAAQAQQRHGALSVSFPEHSRAVSPDGRYAIAGVDSDTEPYHTVFLEDRQLMTRRKLFNYDRSIDLLWNPNSKSFALADRAGSDISRCSIVSVDKRVPTVDVWEKLVKAVDPDEQKNLLANHHVYIAATEWPDSDKLRVKVWGYGDVNPSGLTRFYIYDTHQRFSRDKR